MKKHIPNILTYGRLVLCLVMFAALALISNAVHDRSIPLSLHMLQHLAFWSFVVAAVTDFFDGWLARRWNVVSMTGAILDPIADKILVCGAVIGLVSFGIIDLLFPGATLIFAGLILFREFAVSALREVLAPRGIKLPVTFLAKTKTTLQLVSIAFLMGVIFMDAWAPADFPLSTAHQALRAAQALFGIAAVITVWTGVEYGLAARKALRKA